MANDYAPKQFLRQAEIALIKEYFTARGELGELDWDSMREADADPIHEAWQQLPESSLAQIDSEFRDIFDLATAEGTRTLIEEGQFHQVDLAPELDARDGFLNKALWSFLRHRRIFDVAHLLDRSDHLNRRYWRKRKNVPKKDPDLTPTAVSELERSISAYYKERQGRGRRCHVDKYFRGDRYHYFFAYPQDYADNFVGYDNDGNFQRKRQNPAFEVIFVYDPDEGSIDLFAQGGKDIKKDLLELFARTILHEDLGNEDNASRPYELNGLKKRSFAFPTEPADRITEVRVKEMRFSMIGSARNRVTFDVSPNGSTDEIYDLIARTLDEQRLPMAMVNVSSAVLQVRFDNSNGNGRSTKTVTFRISHPDSCNLKDKPEHLVVKQYLRKWGIERE